MNNLGNDIKKAFLQPFIFRATQKQEEDEAF